MSKMQLEKWTGSDCWACGPCSDFEPRAEIIGEQLEALKQGNDGTPCLLSGARGMWKAKYKTKAAAQVSRCSVLVWIPERAGRS